MSINLNTGASGVGLITTAAGTQQGNGVVDPSAVATASNAGQSPDDKKTAASKPPTREELDKAVNDMRSSAQSMRRKLEFSVDQESGITVVKVLNSDNGELIRQIPSEVVVKLAEDFKESSHVLLSEKA